MQVNVYLDCIITEWKVMIPVLFFYISSFQNYFHKWWIDSDWKLNYLTNFAVVILSLPFIEFQNKIHYLPFKF